jgi:hypothetical protein
LSPDGDPSAGGRDQHILHDGLIEEQLRNLEGAGNAELGDRTRQMRGNVVAKKVTVGLRPEVSRRMLRNVVLPAPFGPMMARFSPS